jgi:hypothetical protein
MGMGTQELLTTEQVGEALHLKADTIARKARQNYLYSSAE